MTYSAEIKFILLVNRSLGFYFPVYLKDLQYYTVFYVRKCGFWVVTEKVKLVKLVGIRYHAQLIINVDYS